MSGGYYDPYPGEYDPSPAAADDYITQRVNEEFARREAIDGINAIFMEEVGKFPEAARETLFDQAWGQVRQAAEQGREMDEAQLRALVGDQAAVLNSFADVGRGPNVDLTDLSDLPTDLQWKIERGQRTGRPDHIAIAAAGWLRDNRQPGR
jgi:hypothetical protein